MAVVSERMGKLCAAAGFNGESARCVEMAERLIEPVLGAPPGWRSTLTEGALPVELSLAMVGQRVEVRALFEPQGRAPTVASQRDAALAFHDRLASVPGVDLTRFRRISDLLLPPGIRGSFALWSAVVFARGEAPAFKAYFNPQIHGLAAAVDVVEDALHRLEMPQAMAALRTRAMRRGPRLDELACIALDLSRSPSARVQIYVRHHHATALELEAMSAMPHATPGAAREFVSRLCGGDGALGGRAAMTCHAFTAGSSTDPAATAVGVPIRAYAPDDTVACERVRAYMLDRDIDPTPYDRMLASDAGVVARASLRRHAGRPRLSIALA